ISGPGLSPKRTGTTPSSAMTSNRQVRPKICNKTHITGGTTTSAMRCARENVELVSLFTSRILAELAGLSGVSRANQPENDSQAGTLHWQPLRVEHHHHRSSAS